MNNPRSHHRDYTDFPAGTKVKIVCHGQDFHFFYGEHGEVTANSGKYLGIRVKFDKPRRFEGGYVQKDFNFEPSDLLVLGEVETEQTVRLEWDDLRRGPFA